MGFSPAPFWPALTLEVGGAGRPRVTRERTGASGRDVLIASRASPPGRRSNTKGRRVWVHCKASAAVRSVALPARDPRKLGSPQWNPSGPDDFKCQRP